MSNIQANIRCSDSGKGGGGGRRRRGEGRGAPQAGRGERGAAGEERGGDSNLAEESYILFFFANIVTTWNSRVYVTLQA
jgi:hypothetical protein